MLSSKVLWVSNFLFHFYIYPPLECKWLSLPIETHLFNSVTQDKIKKEYFVEIDQVFHFISFINAISFVSCQNLYSEKCYPVF